MNVQITLTFDTAQAAQVALAKLSASPPPATEPQPEKEKSAGKPAKTDKPAASPPSASAPAPAPAAPEKAPSVKYEDTPIPGLITELAKNKRAEVAALLTKFGAVTEDGKPKGTLLKPEQYADFEAGLRALTADDLS